MKCTSFRTTPLPPPPGPIKFILELTEEEAALLRVFFGAIDRSEFSKRIDDAAEFFSGCYSERVARHLKTFDASLPEKIHDGLEREFRGYETN
jgi:hypothetical protein